MNTEGALSNASLRKEYGSKAHQLYALPLVILPLYTLGDHVIDASCYHTKGGVPGSSLGWGRVAIKPSWNSRIYSIRVVDGAGCMHR